MTTSFAEFDPGDTARAYTMTTVDFTDFAYDDGGRKAAGYRGDTRDCTRAIAIATETPYQEVYDALWEAVRADPKVMGKHSPRTGLPRKIYERYLFDRGWVWTPTMQVGQGCTVHLRASELPHGRIIARCSRHLVAVIHGVIRDTNPDVDRDGSRCVYGYYAEVIS